MFDVDVAILGAGLSGLHAARLLSLTGADFLLFEAHERLGGRILSAEGFDLGPTWYWPAFQHRVPQLLNELGLAVFEQPARGEVVVEQSPRSYRRVAGGAVVAGSMRVVGGMQRLVDANGHRYPTAS